MLKMPVVGEPQLATTASSEADARLSAALHAQEEPWSHAARSEGLGRCHQAAPKSLILTLQHPGDLGVVLSIVGATGSTIVLQVASLSWQSSPSQP